MASGLFINATIIFPFANIILIHIILIPDKYLHSVVLLHHDRERGFPHKSRGFAASQPNFVPGNYAELALAFLSQKVMTYFE